jgi:hypothetical protein
MVAQCWDFQRHDIQSVVQIEPEPVFLDLYFEVAVGGGYDPETAWSSPVCAKRTDFVLLQHAKKLGLDFGWHLADFIEKSGAFMSGFEESHPGIRGARKRTLHVTEQLTFDEIHGQRSTIDGDELASWAEMIDCPSNQFLAGAALALYQDGHA